jgi:chemotaxis protein methyltransferase CheR
MHEIRCRNIEEYIMAIEKDRKERLQFEHLMTVSISRFFRDRKLWETIKDRILPLLTPKTSQALNVWSAGCAAGEEVYSFKILWESFRKSCTNISNIYILATDIRPEYLDRAKAAVYLGSSMREVSQDIRSTYFETAPRGKFALKSWMKDGIVWQVHDLLSDPPGIACDLIFLRNNLLTYYVDEFKIPTVKRILDRLAPGGFLIIGSHERMPVEVADLKPWEESTIIFQKEK